MSTATSCDTTRTPQRYPTSQRAGDDDEVHDRPYPRSSGSNESNSSLRFGGLTHFAISMALSQAVAFRNTRRKVRRKHCFRWRYYLRNSNLGGLIDRENARS